MAIELVTPIPETKSKPTYPYFGRFDNGTIVFFTAERTGVCMQTDGKHGVGYYGSVWKEHEATPIEGDITFRNVFEK